MIVNDYVHLNRDTPDAVSRILDVEGQWASVYRNVTNQSTGFDSYETYEFAGTIKVFITVLDYPSRNTSAVGEISTGTHNCLINRGVLQVDDKLKCNGREFRVLSVQDSHGVQEAILKEL